METKTPSVGDEVREGGRRAIVTDIRGGVVWLRAAGCEEWATKDAAALTVTRTRDELIAAGDL